MNRLLRILRHRWLDERDAQRTIGVDALHRIEARVAESERHHSGEIRVCVEAGLPLHFLWRDASARERAVAVFGELGVWDTEHDNGVLIYLLLAERSIEIVADRGLNRHVDVAQWQQITDTMAAAFKGGRFEEGLNQAVDAVDALLVRHFPATPGDENPDELPNSPVVR